MKKNQKSLTLLIIILVLLTLCVVGLISWRIYETNIFNAPITQPQPEEKLPSCENGVMENSGVIIVQFNISSKEEQLAIITEELATVNQEYDSFPGMYALNVTKGKEQAAVNAFKAHPGVKETWLNGCGSRM